MSRFVVALALAICCTQIAAGPVRPDLPCDRPILLFGGSTVMAVGVQARGSNDFATRLRVFFRRVCGSVNAFAVSAHRGDGLLEEVDDIANGLAKGPPRIAILHYPLTDIEAGSSVEALLEAYRKVADACAASGSLCIIGGQQPVNAFSQEETDRQLLVERRASEKFGRMYLPIYRNFKSEFGSRRLMLPADSGKSMSSGEKAKNSSWEYPSMREAPSLASKNLVNWPSRSIPCT